MGLYKRKSFEVEAFQWFGDGRQTEDPVWMTEALDKSSYSLGSVRIISKETINRCVAIVTLSGVETAYPGDWIVSGPNGIFVLRSDEFHKFYVKVKE